MSHTASARFPWTGTVSWTTSWSSTFRSTGTLSWTSPTSMTSTEHSVTESTGASSSSHQQRRSGFCRTTLLACSVDLATGTGKSYVIFGLARILLNEGAVDRVLVLCPSTTIESGLLDKFRV